MPSCTTNAYGVGLILTPLYDSNEMSRAVTNDRLPLAPGEKDIFVLSWP